jgi:hypothetical protein
MSSGCMSSYNGCLVDNLSAGVFVMSPCSPQSSTAALRRSAGGSKFARTGNQGNGVAGNQGNGVGFRIPEIRRMVEFTCMSTRLVCAN